jgi:hypothetical protein
VLPNTYIFRWPRSISAVYAAIGIIITHILSVVKVSHGHEAICLETENKSIPGRINFENIVLETLNISVGVNSTDLSSDV